MEKSHTRRSDSEIKDFNKIVEVMEKCDVCRLALLDEEYPYILPLNFGMQVSGGQITLYFHGATEGKKYELMAKNNKASFEMDCSLRLVAQKDMCTMEYESVIGNGIQEVLPHATIFKITVNNITGKTKMIGRVHEK